MILLVSVSISTDKTNVALGGTIKVTITGNDWDLCYTKNNVEQRIATGDESTVYNWTPAVTGNLSLYCYDFRREKTTSIPISVYVLNVAFVEDTFKICNGNVDVRVLVTDENDDPVASKSVSLTGTGSTLTATTDANGVATFSLTGISEDKSLTCSCDGVSDTAVIDYSNPSTLNGSLVCLGRKMASNLIAMGVTGVSEEDGLTSLAEEILNVPSSVVGAELDSAVTCTTSVSSVDVGTSFTISGTLPVSYDDTSSSNTDLFGYLQGASVELYNGNTLLGTAVTDVTGAYSLTYTPSTVGVMSIIAVYEDELFYKGSDTSNNPVSVTVNSIERLSLTGDKSILSYADGDVCGLTATYSLGTGATVQLYNSNDVLVGSMTDEGDGTYTYNYSSTGAGDIGFYAKVGNLVTETYGLIDAKYYASNSRIDAEHFEYNNDRYLFYSTYVVAVNDEIHFRFKSVPTTAIVGIGTWSPNITNQYLIQKSNNTYNLIKNRNGDRSNVSASVHGFYTTQDLIIKVETYNTYNKAVISNGSNTDWWEFTLNSGKIRVDKYMNDDYEIEVFVL